MTHWWLSGGLVGITALLVSVPSRADALRCGERLASSGASLYEVRATCGDPDDAEHSIETVTLPERVLVPCANSAVQRLCEIVVLKTVQIAVDRWTYDFGSNRFIEYARFEQGNLVRVTTGGYGRKNPT